MYRLALVILFLSLGIVAASAAMPEIRGTITIRFYVTSEVPFIISPLFKESDQIIITSQQNRPAILGFYAEDGSTIKEVHISEDTGENSVGVKVRCLRHTPQYLHFIYETSESMGRFDSDDITWSHFNGAFGTAIAFIFGQTVSFQVNLVEVEK